MERTRSNTDVGWYISVFDRRKEKPLPTEVWRFILDWKSVPPECDEEVLELVNGDNMPLEPPNTAETIVIVSMAKEPDPRIFKYRKYFVRDLEGSQARMARRDPGPYGFLTVSAGSDYFETEDGIQISRADMIGHVSGITDVVLYDDPTTLTQRKPSPPKTPHAWTVDTANRIDHYLKLCLYLHNSSWLTAPAQLVYRKPSAQSMGEFVSAQLPHWEQLVSVAAFFRQLCLDPDRAFQSGCDAYMRHASDPVKVNWVKMHKKRFFAALDAETQFGPVQGIKRSVLLDFLLYGTHLFHRDSQRQSDVELGQERGAKKGGQTSI